MSEFVIPYKKVEDIPLSEYKNLHKQYWEFIAEHLEEYIISYFGFIKPNIVNSDLERIMIPSKCFACGYAYKFHSSTIVSQRIDYITWSSCSSCPLKIFHNRPFDCCDTHNIYWKFRRNPSKELALEIANLEWEDQHRE